jgi:ribosome-binding factor A
MSNRFDRPAGARSQRQLRAGENIRHVLVEILARGELHDPALAGMTVTVGEVRTSPDLKHATAFVAGLGGHTPQQVADALNHARKAIRYELGRRLTSKFTPEVRFIPDTSYDDALEMNHVLAQERIRRDVEGAQEGSPAASASDGAS